MTSFNSRRRFGSACGRAVGALALAGTVAGSLLAGWAAPAAAQSLEELKKKGVLTVGLLVDFPPYGILNQQNQPDGYDAEVARLLAKDLGMKVNLVPVTGPNRIPFLLTNKVDVLVASLAVTPERAKQVNFSQPYAAARVIVYGSTKANIKSAEDLKGVRIGVARASTQDVTLTAVAPAGAEIRRFDDDASAMQALLSGQVDAIGCSTTVAAQIDKRAPAKTFEEKFLLRQQVMGIVTRHEQADLQKEINAFIERNKANGELNKLYQKWLGTDMPPMQAS